LMFLISIPMMLPFFCIGSHTYLCGVVVPQARPTTTSNLLTNFLYFYCGSSHKTNKQTNTHTHTHTHIADKILGSHNPPSLLAAKTNKLTNKHPQIKEWKRIFRRKTKKMAKCYHLTQHLLSPSCFQCKLFAIFFFFSFLCISLSHYFWAVDLFGFNMHSC
jgi:hypothetical protein